METIDHFKNGVISKNHESSFLLFNKWCTTGIKNILFLCLIFLVVSCSRNSKKDGETVIIKIDLSANQNEKSIADFQSRFTIRLIPLETANASLIGGIAQIVVTEKDIFIVNAEGLGKFNVLRFDMNGKFLNKIDRTGQGPQEYIWINSIAVSDNKLYVSDNMGKQILQYDFAGNFLNKFPVEHNAYQLFVDQSGRMTVLGSYRNEYGLYIYDEFMNKIASFFPREGKMANMNLTRTTTKSLGLYKNGIYVTNYFDPTVYLIRDNEVKPLAIFDFGRNNLPEDFFAGESQLDKFTEHRKISVMGISNVTVTDDWIIFCPEEGPELIVVYYDRKQNSYMTNKGFSMPYSTFFGKYFAPEGYTETGEYYSSIDSWQLRELIEKLSENDKENYSKYEFFKGIEPTKINEDDNPWLVFYTLK
jgi:hypothetical protein